jgi:hypothetical protein
MATRKNASKTTSKSKSNINLNVKSSKKTQKNAEKMIKNTSGKALLVGLCFLLVGIILGAGAWWFVCRNDCFVIVGNDEIEITTDEQYDDFGVKIVSFGRSLESEEIVVETNLQINAEGKFYADEIGTYYIKYSTNDFKYGTLFKVEKVRLVHVVEPSEGGD